MLSITFVGRAAISRLNARYLGHEGPTDVISFGLVGRASAEPSSATCTSAPRLPARTRACKVCRRERSCSG